MVLSHEDPKHICTFIAESYGSEQIWTCMVLPSTIMVTACAVVARSTSLGHLYMPQVRWSEYQDGFTGNIYLLVREKIL